MTSLQYYCIQGLAEIKNFASQRQNYAPKMQDAQVTKSLYLKQKRHKIYLKIKKNVSYSKQKSKSRSETLKIPSSVSYETKLKFVEIVISVSDLAPDLAILGVIIF